MYLSKIILLIVGDLAEDAFAPEHWGSDSKINSWLAPCGIKRVYKMNKSVTHIVCSRSSYRANAPDSKWTMRASTVRVRGIN